MKVGVVRETFPGEQRVSLVPGVVAGLKKAGLDVLVQAGAGLPAGFPDSEYEEKGATIVPDRRGVLQQADVLLHGHTHRPAVHKVDLGHRTAQRIVLGDWHAEKAWCVRANVHGIHLESFVP